MHSRATLFIALVFATPQFVSADVVHFFNDMGTNIHVKVFVVGTADTVGEFDLATDKTNTVDFNFKANQNFDIIVMPSDDPAAGHQHQNVPLSQFSGQTIELGGERGKIMQCCCYRHHRRWYRCCHSVDIRLATTLTATLENGQTYLSRAPRAMYSGAGYSALKIMRAVDPVNVSRTWTDTTGKYSTEATLINLSPAEVTLIKSATGSTIRVPLEKLSTADQRWAKAQFGDRLAAGPSVK